MHMLLLQMIEKLMEAENFPTEKTRRKQVLVLQKQFPLSQTHH